jgi:hypothetical protein
MPTLAWHVRRARVTCVDVLAALDPSPSPESGSHSGGAGMGLGLGLRWGALVRWGALGSGHQLTPLDC